MQITKLSSESILPLTCSRSGTCCFGKDVMLNPWELLNFSKEKKITPRAFRDLYTEFGGIQLLMIGDLQQLSPVVKDNEWHLLKPFYKNAFFFMRRSYHTAHPEVFWPRSVGENFCPIPTTVF